MNRFALLSEYNSSNLLDFSSIYLFLHLQFQCMGRICFYIYWTLFEHKWGGAILIGTDNNGNEMSSLVMKNVILSDNSAIKLSIEKTDSLSLPDTRLFSIIFRSMLTFIFSFVSMNNLISFIVIHRVQSQCKNQY
jgi:hypothetical protein